jgi:hypothetical protein
MTGRVSRFLVCVLVAVAIGVGGGAVHPFGRVKGDAGTAPLNGAAIDPATLSIIERSCGNCHSERVKWPWYSYVAPTSWMVENDVSRARARMNLSRWADYTSQEQETLLGAMGAAVRTGEMPPQRYRSIHPEAELSGVERNRLYEWSRAERRRIRQLPSLK